MKHLFTFFFSFLYLSQPLLAFSKLPEIENPSFQFKNLYNVQYLRSFFVKLDALVEGKKFYVNIAHIGDSHIQADHFTQTCRKLWQQDFGNAGRGFFFPYQLASSNGPTSFIASSTGNWKANRSTKYSDNGPFGLTGISLTTQTKTSGFKLAFLDSSSSDDFIELDCFYKSIDETAPRINGLKGNTLPEVGSRFFFDSLQRNITLKLESNLAANHEFSFFGFNAKNGYPGVLYHSLGLNGASVKSTLKNTYFSEHLKILSPHLVIISLGTNDGFMPQSKFCSPCFENDLRQLIARVKKSNEKVSILLTTPGDSYRQKKYHNYNNPEIKRIIIKLADEMHFAVWDFNQWMGGEFSMKKWHSKGWAQNDLVHFTKAGYKFMGQQLYESILEAYEKRMD